MSAVLTKKQLAVYEFIDAYSKLHGEAPTFQEIGSGLNLASSNTVFHHVKKLKEKGYLRESSSGKRRYKILNPAPWQIAALPDLIEAAENVAAILDGMAEHSKTHAAAVMVDTDLIRSLRSALTQAKGGER